jgi:hypothetical protein
MPNALWFNPGHLINPIIPELQQHIDKSIEELEEKLDALVMKFAIMGGKLITGGKGEKRYSLSQRAIGM